MLVVRHAKNAIIALLLITLLAAAGACAVDRFVSSEGGKYIVSPSEAPPAKVAIIPGAYATPDGQLCDMLADRVKTGVELYQANKVDKLLMTGDHGQVDYDEVNSMREYAERLGVPPGDIFMDHAGFNTYDSMYRAKDVFLVKSALIVTQRYHLPRAVYIARSLGLDARGVGADKQVYAGMAYYTLRESLARCKAFLQVRFLRPKPRFLGEAIPIDGDGRTTHDRPARPVSGKQ
ncbi:MAG: YdcF family protein [Firmicutes bacterium]|nr:YdcF family protein [Bacillota bacterium]